jgi:hypothetical protein
MTSQNRLERSVSIVSDPFSDPDVYYGEDDVRKRLAHRRTFSAVRNEPPRLNFVICPISDANMCRT